MSWAVRRHAGHPAELHAREVTDPVARAVWVCDPTGAALVLGSAQPAARVDHLACAKAGIDVVRRRSGGGAVLVVPGDLLWVDLVIPAGDPLWHADVGVAFHWVGDAWAAALGALGHDVVVHRGALVRSRWSADVCFAGRGPGEVTLGGRKVVGISQRRTRGWARFQCAALRRWDPTAMAGLLALDPDARRRAEGDLAGMAAGIEDDLEAVLAAFLRQLPPPAP